MLKNARRKSQRGVSLIEVMIAIVVIFVASIGALSFYTYGMAGVEKAGRRRAALERARQRMDAIMATPINQIAGTNPNDDDVWWLTDSTPNGTSHTWVRSNVLTTETVIVDDMDGATGNPDPPVMETTIQQRDDASDGNDPSLDTVLISVKVWYTGETTDDDYNRVCIQTLRTP